MSDHSEGEESFPSIEQHIRKLAKRANALRVLVAPMEAKGQDKRNQSELLANILKPSKLHVLFLVRQLTV